MPTGSCLCQAVKVEYEGEPAMTALCHCSDCRHISGGNYSNNIVVPSSNFKVTSGKPKEYTKTADSGKSITSCFCKWFPADKLCVIVQNTLLTNDRWRLWYVCFMPLLNLTDKINRKHRLQIWRCFRRDWWYENHQGWYSRWYRYHQQHQAWCRIVCEWKSQVVDCNWGSYTARGNATIMMMLSLLSSAEVLAGRFADAIVEHLEIDRMYSSKQRTSAQISQ